jgi:hypothetical protein
LLLCGSALSFMGGLLSGTAPLRGRAGLEPVVRTLATARSPAAASSAEKSVHHPSFRSLRASSTYR